MKQKIVLLFVLITAICIEMYGEWVSSGGPEGNNVSTLIYHNNVIIAQTTKQVFYKLEDNGNTWSNLPLTGITLEGYSDVAMISSGTGLSAYHKKTYLISNNGQTLTPYFITVFNQQGISVIRQKGGAIQSVDVSALSP